MACKRGAYEPSVYEPLDGTGALKSYNMYSAIFVFMFSTRCDAVTHNAVESTVHNTTSSSYIPHEYIFMQINNMNTLDVHACTYV